MSVGRKLLLRKQRSEGCLRDLLFNWVICCSFEFTKALLKYYGYIQILKTSTVLKKKNWIISFKLSKLLLLFFREGKAQSKVA